MDAFDLIEIVPYHLNDTYSMNSSQVEDGGLHHHTYTDTTPAIAKIVRDVILPVICSCGIMGIMLTIIVLSRKSMNTTTNCYLTGLAIADLFFLILFGTRLLEKHFSDMNNISEFYAFQIYATYASILMNVFLLSSIWITVVLAIERYIAICRPFVSAQMFTVPRARAMIALTFLVCFICRLPNFWLYRIERVYDASSNASLTYIIDSNLATKKSYFAVYPWIVDVIITSVIPFILLLILNACLIWQVRKSTAYISRNSMIASHSNSSVHREELQITTMLISVIMVFFICQAPYVIYVAIVSINSFVHSSGLLMFRYAAMLLLTVKSAVNFIMYCWFSQRFRATLRRTLCVDTCRKRCYGSSTEMTGADCGYKMKDMVNVSKV